MQPDRFAREIVAFLTLFGAARLRRLMRNPLGGNVKAYCVSAVQRYPKPAICLP
jgi:hypothetical protein